MSDTLMKWGDADAGLEAKDLIGEKMYEQIRNYMACGSCGESGLSEEVIAKKIDEDKDGFQEKLEESIISDQFFWEEAYECDKDYLHGLIKERLSDHGLLICDNRDSTEELWCPDSSTKSWDKNNLNLVDQLFDVLFWKKGWRSAPDTFTVSGWHDTTKGKDFEISAWHHSWHFESLDQLSAALHDARTGDGNCGFAEWDAIDQLHIDGELVGCVWPLSEIFRHEHQEVIYVAEKAEVHIHARQPTFAGKVVAANPDSDYDFTPGYYRLFPNVEELVRYHLTGSTKGTELQTKAA